LTIWKKKLRENSNHIFFADVNLDLLVNNNKIIKYKDMLTTSGFSLVNKIYPTRISTNKRTLRTTRTLIDHIITNCSDDFKIDFSIEDNSLSDHKLTIASLHTTIKDKVPMNNKIVRKTNYNQFRRFVAEDLNKNNIGNVDDLIQTLQQAKERSTKTIRVRTRNKNWITPLVLEKMKERKKAYDVFKKDPTNVSKKTRYMNTKKAVEKLLKEEKSKFVSKKIEEAGNNCRKVWKIIKHDLSNTTDDGKSTTISSVIDKNGKAVVSSIDIANTFNNFFNNVGENIVKDIKRNASANCSQFKIYNDKTLFFSPVSEQEVYEIIMSLNKNATPGIDKITVSDLQELVLLISSPLTKMINKCLSDGIFPESLKKAYIIPIHKQGKKDECGNYRPISILNSLSKVFEKVINLKIRNFIQNTIGFDENQYGFLEKSGTESAIAATLEQIYDALDEGYYVGAVFIDLTKAFDVVNHSKLLERLDDLGIRGISNDLLKSYLTNRSQCVKINNVCSNELNIKTGVPQGSLLGPLLYLLYIMNIPKHKMISSYNIYADDTNLIAKSKTLDELEKTINKDLRLLSEWLDLSELAINVKKTNYIIFKVPNKKYNQIELKINGSTIQNVSCVKYLGIYIDEFLKWDKQIVKIKKSVIPVITAIRRCGGLPKQAAKLVFNGFILSQIRYNICSWSNCAKFHIEQIGTIMNKSLKSLLKLSPRTSTKDLYKNTGYLDINQLIYFEKSKYIFNIKKGNQKSKLILQERNEIHNYNTRNRNNINIPKVKTTKNANSLKCSAIKIYNSLPSEIKNCQNVHIFKKKLKKHIQNFRT